MLANNRSIEELRICITNARAEKTLLTTLRPDEQRGRTEANSKPGDASVDASTVICISSFYYTSSLEVIEFSSVYFPGSNALQSLRGKPASAAAWKAVRRASPAAPMPKLVTAQAFRTCSLVGPGRMLGSDTWGD